MTRTRPTPPLGALPRHALAVLAALVGALLLTGCGGRAEAPPPEVDDGLARPPFVRVDTDDGPTLFLLGTLHLGPAEGWRFSPEIVQVLASADTLVMELDLSRLDPD